MTRQTRDTLDPLFLRMCQVAKDQLDSGTPTGVFPIHMKFPTPQAAQHYRCQFYTFRRLLASRAKTDPTLESTLFGAEAIMSPRLGYDIPNADGSYNLYFKLRSFEPVAINASTQLLAALGAATPSVPVTNFGSLAEPEPESHDYRDIQVPTGILRVYFGDSTDTNRIKSDTSLLTLYKLDKLPNAELISDDIPQ